MSDSDTCPGCDSQVVEAFFDLRATPVNVGVQWPTADAARECPKGDIRLSFCHDCGLITNGLFDESLIGYTGEYDNSLSFSPYYQTFARDLAERLVDRYAVRRKSVIEIGCGAGDFLRLVCEVGNNHGVGFDPTYTADKTTSGVEDRVEFVRGYYSPKYAHHQGDLICCRHVLEHVFVPQVFLRTLREIIGDNANVAIYFEVPNVRTILRDLAVWTIIYEHCLYFSVESLAHVFGACGFAVQHVGECYERQFLGLEAKPAPVGVGCGDESWGDLGELTDSVASFSLRYKETEAVWRRRLDQMGRAGTRAVAWGAGAKTIGLFNALGIGDEVPYVVDINPRKHGAYLAGTAQEVVGPEFLREYEPTTVIIMNDAYKDEIHATIEGLGLDVEYVYA